jgi:hypothetical protein
LFYLFILQTVQQSINKTFYITLLLYNAIRSTPNQ